MIGQIGLAALVAWLMLWSEHWFPWRLLLRRDLPRIPAYTLGVLALAFPLTGIFLYWVQHPPCWEYAHLAALWVVIVSGGVAVLAAYVIDWIVLGVVELIENNERLGRTNESMRQGQ